MYDDFTSIRQFVTKINNDYGEFADNYKHICYKILSLPDVTEEDIRKYADPNRLLGKKRPAWMVRVLISMGRTCVDSELLDWYYDDDVIVKFVFDNSTKWPRTDVTANALLDKGYDCKGRITGSGLNSECYSFTPTTRQRIYDLLPDSDKESFRLYGELFIVDNGQLVEFAQIEDVRPYLHLMSKRQINKILEKENDIEILFAASKFTDNYHPLTDRHISLDARWLEVASDHMLIYGNWTFDVFDHLNTFKLLMSKARMEKDSARCMEKIFSLKLTKQQVKQLEYLHRDKIPFPSIIPKRGLNYLMGSEYFCRVYRLPTIYNGDMLTERLTNNPNLTKAEVKAIIISGKRSIVDIVFRLGRLPESKSYLFSAMQDARLEIINLVLNMLTGTSYLAQNIVYALDKAKHSKHTCKLIAAANSAHEIAPYVHLSYRRDVQALLTLNQPINCLMTRGKLCHTDLIDQLRQRGAYFN